MAEMRYYIVTASWDREPCYECEGSTGQAFVFVRAHSGQEAVETARESLVPMDYGQPRGIVATPLAMPVSPQARTPRRIAERELAVRARSYVTVLKPSRSLAGHVD